jgi:hypothetical protein
MFHPLDMFKTDPDSSVLWLGAVTSFVAAKARIENLEGSSPGEYLILDQITGHKVRVVMGISTTATAAGVLTTATA